MTQSCVITLDTGEIRRNSCDCGAHNDSRTHVNHTLEKTITKKKNKNNYYKLTATNLAASDEWNGLFLCDNSPQSPPFSNNNKILITNQTIIGHFDGK